MSVKYKPTIPQLSRAMVKAVELDIFPEWVSSDTYLRNWEALRKILTFALQDVDLEPAAEPKQAALWGE